MLNLALSDAFRPGFAQSLLGFMSHPASFTTTRDPLPDQEQKQAALSYLNEAWAEARHDGVDGDCLAQASLFAAFAELVGTYGEDAVAKFVEGLPPRVPPGRPSTPRPDFTFQTALSAVIASACEAIHGAASG